jgi:hypothetical protein
MDLAPTTEVDVVNELLKVVGETVTKNGKTNGLATYAGRFAECTISGLIHELTTLESSRVSLAVEFREQPG